MSLTLTSNSPRKVDGPVVHCGDIADVFERFIANMSKELLDNAAKGDRSGPNGWLRVDRKTCAYEIADHAAKLHMALKELERFRSIARENGVSGYAVARAERRVAEFSADLANAALIAADVAGVL